jgi:flagellar hook protein FlgE
MSRSLYAGASGLIAHQRKLDIVANNLANLNTTGFKTQRILFSDLLYQKVINEANPIGESFGGRNPGQLGNGVRASQVNRKWDQGTLQSTGEQYDMAIVGEGFFVVSDGRQNFYTRDGSFTVNRDGLLVNGAGMLVQRLGSYGDPTDTTVGFQTPGSTSIKIPLGKTTLGARTVNGTFSGNLPLTATGPRVNVMTSNQPLMAGGTAATATTLLNNLDTNEADYVAGDFIRLSGANPDGSVFSFDMPVSGTTTVGDLINSINATMTGVTATLSTAGNIVLTDDATGASKTALNLADVNTNTGATSFDTHDLRQTTVGKAGDIHTTTVQFFNEQGQAQAMVVNFQKQSGKVWDATFSLSEANGTMVDSVVRGIEFNDDGTFRRVNGVGTDGSTIEIDFDDLAENQRINLDFSELNHNPGTFSSFFDQDGFATGVLFAFAISPDGTAEAISTNGVRIPLAQLAIADFKNENALSAMGNNLYVDTIASGSPQVGPGMTAERGQVLAGNLEQSNVDIAFEFTQLIIAQRGFSANARTITVTDNVLQEMINIVR